ncbi:MAG: hypothetical protein K7J46_03520 [Bryobacter sp.]|jgi:hypothetical protein|nr:hypothetical protein [Bryobacter sp. CoA8 C33]
MRRLNSTAGIVLTTVFVAALTQYVPAIGSRSVGGSQYPDPRRLFHRKCR